MIGQTVSHYRILERLGGGGMGVVYRAEDTKLKRTVALKFLPPELTRDEEAKQRFVHEAQAASALQHPNICTIHDVDETADNQLFIVMDCYEGETLKQKIERGPLKIEEATDLAIQISQGLAEAHEHGIVHRDVKPANILVTKNGLAKIVDFGLAKLSGRTKLTKTGSTLGTVAYMSPEQLQDSNVDARADIFSFGVVLYEMLTGKTPFRGDHEAALMYSIINEEPEPLQQFIPDVSSELIHIVSRALEKSPADRYRTMDDLLIDLRRLRRETSKVSMPAFKRIAQRRFMGKFGLLIASCTILIAAFVVLFVLPSRTKSPELNPSAVTRSLDIPMTTVYYPYLSPDGKWVAFSAPDAKGTWDIYFMNTSGGGPRRVTFDSSAMCLIGTISPDGAWLVYQHRVKNSYQLSIVSSLGGESRKLVNGGRPCAWLERDNRIMYQRSKWDPSRVFPSSQVEIWTVKSDGSDERFEFTDSGFRRGELDFFSYSVSPDEASIAWIKNFPDFTQELMIHSRASHENVQITFDQANIDEVVWSNDNYLLYSCTKGGNLDLWRISPQGGMQSQVTRSAVAELYGHLSSDDSRLLYYQAQQNGNIMIGDLATGAVQKVTSDDTYRAFVSISPDGQQVAFASLKDDGYSFQPPTAISWIDRKGEKQKTLVTGEPFLERVRWSPDGKWLLYITIQSSVAAGKVCVTSASSPGSPKLLGYGKDPRWVDSHTVCWFNQMKTWIADITDPHPEQFYEDSTFAMPILGKNNIVYRDYRSGRQGWWIDRQAKSEPSGHEFRKKVVEPGVPVAVSQKGLFLLCNEGRNGLWKVSLPDGKKERVAHRFADLEATRGRQWDPDFDVRDDGKEFVYVLYKTSDKLVLVENPFIWK